MNLFKDAETVGDLKKLLENIPDDTQLFQTSSVSGGYRRNVRVLSLNESNINFTSWHNNIKVYQSLEDKIKGTNNDLKNIVIFGS